MYQALVPLQLTDLHFLPEPTLDLRTDKVQSVIDDEPKVQTSLVGSDGK